MAIQWNRRGRKRRPQETRKTGRSAYRRALRTEQLENRHLLAADLFHNAAMPEDVNQDGEVTPIDALSIINQLNRGMGGDLQAQDTTENRETSRRMMTDVNNDRRLSPADALSVIHRINRGNNRRPDIDTGSDERRDDPQPPVDDSDPRGDEDRNSQEQTDVVLEWNNLFSELLVLDESQQNPGYASRSMAMLNLAIYDSVAVVDGEPGSSFYEYDTPIPENADLRSEITASQAAYTVLSELYPEQQSLIDSFRDQQFARFQRNANTGTSIDLGTEIGNSVIAARASDGHDATTDYTYSNEAGSFQPDPLNPDVPVWGPAWGEVDTFAIGSSDDFLPESTPGLTSQQYADSYNEVKELGSVDSQTRTADQTEAGIFWAYDRTGLGTPMHLFGDVLETISVQQGNTFHENAALFAQASVAMADAGVVAWQTKFSEQFWRPVTAIHQGDADGNDLTEGDSDWVALGAPDGGDDVVGFTPQFPTYVSGHATFGGALFGAIQEFYGTDDIAFELSSRELEIIMENPALEEAYGLDLEDSTRSFSTLSEAMAENGRSRVYLGIHFDFDDIVGQEVGQAIASSVSSQFVVSGGQPDRPQPPGNGGPQRPSDPRDGGRRRANQIAGPGQQDNRTDPLDDRRLGEDRTLALDESIAGSIEESIAAVDEDSGRRQAEDINAETDSSERKASRKRNLAPNGLSDSLSNRELS